MPVLWLYTFYNCKRKLSTLQVCFLPVAILFFRLQSVQSDFRQCQKKTLRSAPALLDWRKNRPNAKMANFLRPGLANCFKALVKFPFLAKFWRNFRRLTGLPRSAGAMKHSFKFSKIPIRIFYIAGECLEKCHGPSGNFF